VLEMNGVSRTTLWRMVQSGTAATSSRLSKSG
jgi:hypothetical protein